MSIVKDAFGRTSAGAAVDRYTLANGGIEMQCLTYGAIITRLLVPDRDGHAGDIALGFDTLAEYERDSPYFGAIVGRYANRIADACLELDGVRYQLAANEGRHHLHGGRRGFDKQIWDAREVHRAGGVGLRLSRTSPDGEEGYPGELGVEVTYWLSDRGQVIIDFSAVTSATTVVNLTQHTYFNLSGDLTSRIDDHVLTVRASRYLPVDEDLIPHGVLQPVHGTAFDFLTPRAIGERLEVSDQQLRHAGGYDHTLVLDSDGVPAASLYHPASGRKLTVTTTEPGLQLYSGNRLNVTGSLGRHYGRHGAVCLEAHHFPNSPACPQFPSAVLRPGQRFSSTTVWSFTAA